MKFFAVIFDAIFITRPLLLVPVWGFSIFGLIRGLHSVGKVSGRPFSLIRFDGGDLFWMFIFSLSVAAVYVINQIADFEVDKSNSGTPLLARGNVSKTTAIISAWICAIVSLTVPIFFHPTLSMFAASALVLGLIYSKPPLRLSGRCFFDFLANASGYGIIAFGAGWYLSGAGFALARFSLNALPYFLLMCAGSISSTLPDYAADKQWKKNTTAVVLGVKPAHVLATCILSLDLIVSLEAADFLGVICAACSLPLYCAYLIRPNAKTMEATYKGGGLICMLAAFVNYPGAASAAVLVAIGTWLYFKIRHHTTYPSLVPVHQVEK